MAKDRLEFASPLKAVGVLLGVGAILFIGRRFISAEPSVDDSKPAFPQGTIPPSSPPNPSIRTFTFQGGESRVTRPWDTEFSIPTLNYQIQTPLKVNSNRMEAWIAGRDGSRLDLRISTQGSNTIVLDCQGYSHAPPEPHLVVRHAGKVVVDEPVAPLVSPIRVIPLVVPLDASLGLRPTKERPGWYGIPGQKARWFEIVGDPIRGWDGAGDHLMRSEWAPGGYRYTLRKDSTLPAVFTSDHARPKAFAEIETTTVRKERFVRDFTLDIELYEEDGKPRVRVSEPLRIPFPDHALLVIPKQEPRVQGNQRSGLPGNINLVLQDTAGVAPLFSANVQFTSPGAVLQDSRRSAFGNVQNPPAFRCELLSPRLEDLGIWRLSLGVLEVARLDKPAPARLALGRHRLQIRAIHDAEVPMHRRRFVRVLAHPASRENQAID